ncbi:DUF3841 domain-containing protein [Hespellia stercorisuis]|uniref:DUF3841 domain-containing protein n=1 Tax=Hespellia stercorisuis DSM 15480 TaxID=1121950 RepID=A0A1M6RUR3_9FIRM|nr:DUF3841 domain-containing protein [Hespellia stercorisuis]SHK36150.1 protein of unknown function [Hespellia stercorisuis DSM 15480]
MENNYVTMWTAQAQIVLDALERDGIYYVKKSYIDQKYRETAWSFRTAYTFFTENAQRIIPKPEKAESPVWMFKDPRWAKAGEGASTLKLHIPCDQLILFDRRKWTKILSLDYIGDEGECREFEKELERQGIMTSSDVFERPFYPMVKKKIMKSWERLFLDEKIEEEYVQGAAWFLKKEWVCQE